MWRNIHPVSDGRPKGGTVPHKAFLVVMRLTRDRPSQDVIVKQFDTLKEAEAELAWRGSCGDPNRKADYQSRVVEKANYRHW